MMKTHRFFIATCLTIITSTSVMAQLTGNGPSLSHDPSKGSPSAPRDMSAFSNLLNINGSDGIYLKKNLYLVDYYTVINGQKVLGLPFLYAEWCTGTISTPDGREYTDYKLKYNVQNQSVSFLNGNDSMEVNESIKDFTLKVAVGDSLITSRFANSTQYQKNGKELYYEVLIDNEKGQLLKTNTKKVATADDGIIASSTSRYLKLESDYFFYDKKTKKLTKIKPDNDLKSTLNLTDAQAKDLYSDTYEPASEESLLMFFKRYFERAKLNGL
ncbi:MAG: hypothetical protein ABI480_06825 [Chitinophagaceae bacterium]